LLRQCRLRGGDEEVSAITTAVASARLPPPRHASLQAWGRLLDCDGSRRSAVGSSFV
jgi:hypothetical protein